MAHGPGIELRPADEGRWAPVKLARPHHDPRSAAEFRAALERETTASLRADPSRWSWRLSDRVRDTHRGRQQRARWW